MGTFAQQQWVIVRLGPGYAVPSSVTGFVGPVTPIKPTKTRV
jgi:hypothetical protein